MSSFQIPRILIAGTSGNVGKTTTTVALACALKARGLKVATFKCGPDFLDPTYHGLAVGKPSQNLDTWMMGRDGVLHTLHRAAADADIALIEGMMGLYDGLAPNKDTASSAQLAKWLEAPVLLVTDAAAMARSIGAIALGYRDFDKKLSFAGLIANYIGSQSHLNLLKRSRPCIPILGGLPRDGAEPFPERHLGLEAAHYGDISKEMLENWGRVASEYVDLDAVLEAARRAPALELPEQDRDVSKQPSCRIGIARDAAFHFYYEENLRLLEQAGAELVYFSPLNDTGLPGVDALWIGGGYPELYAVRLSKNASMRAAIKAFGESGRPVYGECGGLMYLTAAIRLKNGDHYPMVGLLPGSTEMMPRLQAIGYTEVVTLSDSLLGSAGTRFRGHQFRHSRYLPPETDPGRPAYGLHPFRGEEVAEEGLLNGSVLGTYVHAHWASNPSIPKHLVATLSRSPG